MWDFVLHRDDGTGVRLHPNWSNRKVAAFALSPHADTVQSPKAGLGQSDGRGTFRYYADLGVERTFHFDCPKEKQGSMWFRSSEWVRSRGASASSTGASASTAARRVAMGEEAPASGSAAVGPAAAGGLAAAGLS